MLGGTFLPAFVAVGIISLITKQPVSMRSAKNLLVFGLASAVGGFVTAKMIKNVE